MSTVNSEIAEYIADYFEKRPQLEQPQKNVLGYHFETPAAHIIESLFAKNKRLRKALEFIAGQKDKAGNWAVESAKAALIQQPEE